MKKNVGNYQVVEHIVGESGLSGTLTISLLLCLGRRRRRGGADPRRR